MALCCHSRLLKEIISDTDNVNLFINQQKIAAAKLHTNDKCMKLSSKNNVDRFSVVADETAEFVTICNVAQTNRNVIKCHSFICKMLEGSTRSVKYLYKGNKLCPHLEEFKGFYNAYLRNTLESDESSGGEDDEYVDDYSENLPEEKVNFFLD